MVKPDFEIQVVDNSTVQEFIELNRRHTAIYETVGYFQETRVGLSHARNTGAAMAKGEWLVYIDDDTYVFPNFFSRLLTVLPTSSYPCIGGRIHPYFEAPKPRWLPVDFKIIDFWPVSDLSPIPGDDKILGGLMAIKKQLLEAVGSFPTTLGMAGTVIAYGEETYVQHKIQQLGHTIGYDPQWNAYHLVGKHKYRMRWHIQAYFANGRDSFGLTYQHYSSRELIRDVFKALFERLPKGIGKLLFRRRYYWQNLVLEVMKPLAFSWGKWQRIRQLTAK